MRIISQYGNNNFPYEITALHQCSGVIRANMAGETGKGTIMASYLTDEIALKVLNILDNVYYQNVFENIYHDKTDIVTANFRFPQDDEIE